MVILPSSVAARIRRGGNWGYLFVRHDPAQNLLVVAAASKGDQVMRHAQSRWLENHYTGRTGTPDPKGYWYRAAPELTKLALGRLLRHLPVRTEEELRPHIIGGWNLAGDRTVFALTYSHVAEGQEAWFGWMIDRKEAQPFRVDFVDEDEHLYAPLGPGWPGSQLERAHVLLLGAGSIGSAAAESLAAYAIRRMTLIDPERLVQRNFARHRARRSTQGMFKVDAVRELLLERDADIEIDALRLDLVADADRIRGVLLTADAVLVSTDGVESRKAANHLVRWARKPAVFACVLEDGAYGEVVRTLPARTGCLTCLRDRLFDTSGLEPEPELDRDYRHGGGARPMTAVGGDLGLVGALAAKVTVATLLERGGDHSARLPGDQLLVALRPKPDLLPPFDMTATLEADWFRIGPPNPTCPDCGRPAVSIAL